MKKQFLISIAVILSFNYLLSEVRPIRDDVGYFWEGKNFRKLIKFIENNQKPPSPTPPLVGGISPHDDYLYAGEMYYPLYKKISTREAVVFGVTHSTVRKSIGDHQSVLIFDNHPYWQGLNGNVKISVLREWLKEKLAGDILVHDDAHKQEHSIEATLPFLQFFNPAIHTTPIMVTAMPIEKMEVLTTKFADAITEYMKERNLTLGEDIFFLISADANHYGEDFGNAPFGTDERAHRLGTELDKGIIMECLTGVIDAAKCRKLADKLWGETYHDHSETLWCGRYSIPFGLLTLIKVVENMDGDQRLIGTLFGYSDTYTRGVIPLQKTGHGITAPFSLRHWVGFFSAGFYLEKR